MLKNLNTEPKYQFTKEQAKKLSKLRIIQKNLVHFQGFPESLNNQDILEKYFNQFGKIMKFVLGQKKEEEIQKKRTNSAYITYSRNEEAAIAILTMDSLIIEGHLVRAFFGTTKYCVHFLNNLECFNKEKCMFIHYIADNNDILGINSKFDYNDHINLAKKILANSNFNYKNLVLNVPIKENFCKEDTSQIRKNSSSSNSSNHSTNNNKNNNILFKFKEKSRFFCNNINNNDNIEISNSVKNLIDNLCIRIGFFKKFDKYYNNKKYEIEFCKKKFETSKDPLIKYVLNNTSV